ncbi:MAG: hypothetical protein WCB48_00680, partial [Casimicrobiaceae bacterium]
MIILLHVLVAAIYAAAAWALWPRGDAPSPAHRNAGLALLAGALVLHAVAIFQAVARPEGLDLSLVNALSMVAGLAVLVAWLTGVMRTLPGVTAV